MGVIYRIKNVTSGRTYVGSAARHSDRWKTHRHLLRKGTHHSPSLQRSWDKHGEEAFTFEVIEEVENARLLEREQFWIDELKAADPDLGFNVSPVAGTRRGVPQPESVAEALRKVHQGKPKSAEHKAKIGAARKGQRKSPEHRERISEGLRKAWADGKITTKPPKSDYWKGKKLSAETREKMRQAALLRVQNGEGDRLRKMASAGGAASKARGKTPEEREAIRRMWSERREELSQKYREAWVLRKEKAAAEGKPVMTRKPHSEETKAKMRAAWDRRRAKIKETA